MTNVMPFKPRSADDTMHKRIHLIAKVINERLTDDEIRHLIKWLRKPS